MESKQARLPHDVPVKMTILWKNVAADVETVKILSLAGVNLNQIPLATLLTVHVSGEVKSENAPVLSYPWGIALLVIAVAFSQLSFGGRGASWHYKFNDKQLLLRTNWLAVDTFVSFKMILTRTVICMLKVPLDCERPDTKIRYGTFNAACQVNVSRLPLSTTHVRTLHVPENTAIWALNVGFVKSIFTILSLPRKLYQAPTSVAATLHIVVLTSEVASDVSIPLWLNGMLDIAVAALHLSLTGLWANVCDDPEEGETVIRRDRVRVIVVKFINEI